MNVDFLFPIWQILPWLLVSLGAEHTHIQKNKTDKTKKKNCSDGWITLWRTERNDDDDAETIIIITRAHNERVIIITHTVCFIMRYMEEGQGGIRELGGKRSSQHKMFTGTRRNVCAAHICRIGQGWRKEKKKWRNGARRLHLTSITYVTHEDDDGGETMNVTRELRGLMGSAKSFN